MSHSTNHNKVKHVAKCPLCWSTQTRIRTMFHFAHIHLSIYSNIVLVCIWIWLKIHLWFSCDLVDFSVCIGMSYARENVVCLVFGWDSDASTVSQPSWIQHVTNFSIHSMALVPIRMIWITSKHLPRYCLQKHFERFLCSASSSVSHRLCMHTCVYYAFHLHLSSSCEALWLSGLFSALSPSFSFRLDRSFGYSHLIFIFLPIMFRK